MRSASMRITSSRRSDGDGLVVAGHVEVGEGVVAAAVARHGARELGRRQRAGPLEHHVLEEMGDAGLAVGLVGAADLVDQHLGHDRRAARRQHDDLQAVRQGEGFGRPAVDLQQAREGRGARRQQGAGEEAAESSTAAHGRALLRKCLRAGRACGARWSAWPHSTACPVACASRRRCCSFSGSTTTPGVGLSCQKIRLSMKVLSFSARVRVSRLTWLRMLGSTPPAPALAISACSEASPGAPAGGPALLLHPAGHDRRQRFLGLVGRRGLLRPRLAGPRRTKLGVGRHGERRMGDDLEFVRRDLLAAAEILEGAAAAEREGADGGEGHRKKDRPSHHLSLELLSADHGLIRARAASRRSANR